MPTTTTQQEPRKPTAKQVYCFAHLMADALGLDWPTDRAECSAHIQRLKAHLEAEKAGAASSEVPF